jgi:hypothetical protein
VLVLLVGGTVVGRPAVGGLRRASVVGISFSVVGHVARNLCVVVVVVKVNSGKERK